MTMKRLHNEDAKNVFHVDNKNVTKYIHFIYQV